MESKNIILFQPMRSTWHIFCEFRNRPLIEEGSADTRIKKRVVWLVNESKNRLTEVALVVTTVFSFLYSLITYPIRVYQNRKLERLAIQLDLDRFSPEEQIEARRTIEDYFKKHEEAFSSLSLEEKQTICEKVLSQCARSQKVYGPIVRNWVDHLLKIADQDDKKLVFMARDGIPFYQVATELMKKDEYKIKFPQLAQKDNPIVLGHFSRNVVTGAKEKPDLFKRYVTETLQIKEGESCIFVDIGFSGSMVEPIRKLLPDRKIDFHFLVATTNKAQGFLGNPQKPLSNLLTAANNLGVRWVEESHHGNLASAQKLVEGEDGRVYSDNLYPKKVLCEEKFSLQYLLRKFCLKGVVKYAVNLPSLSEREAMKAKDVFNETIGAIKNMELPVFLGWDY